MLRGYGSGVRSAELVDGRGERLRNPLIGRALPQLVVDAGLTVVKTWATPILYPSLETDAYIDALVEADRRGHFVFAALAVSVVATAASASDA
jgi:hypothetical protein